MRMSWCKVSKSCETKGRTQYLGDLYFGLVVKTVCSWVWRGHGGRFTFFMWSSWCRHIAMLCELEDQENQGRLVNLCWLVQYQVLTVAHSTCTLKYQVLTVAHSTCTLKYQVLTVAHSTCTSKDHKQNNPLWTTQYGSCTYFSHAVWILCSNYEPTYTMSITYYWSTNQSRPSNLTLVLLRRVGVQSYWFLRFKPPSHDYHLEEAEKMPKNNPLWTSCTYWLAFSVCWRDWRLIIVHSYLTRNQHLVLYENTSRTSRNRRPCHQRKRKQKRRQTSLSRRQNGRKALPKNCWHKKSLLILSRHTWSQKLYG